MQPVYYLLAQATVSPTVYPPNTDLTTTGTNFVGSLISAGYGVVLTVLPLVIPFVISMIVLFAIIRMARSHIHF